MKNRKYFFLALFFAVSFHACVYAQKTTVSYPLKDVVAQIQKKTCDGKFSFAVFADTHSNTTIFPFMLSMADKLEPAFIMDAGDFTNNGKNEEYELVISQVKAVNTPVLFAPGNHEYRNPTGHTSSVQIKRYGKMFGLFDYAFDYCGWKFIAMDVVALDQMFDGQLTWLEEQIKNAGGKVAIFFHYPPGNIPKWDVHEGNYFKVNADKFTALAQKYKVRYVFAGHYHVYDRIKINDTTYILVGAGGGAPDATPPSQLNSPDAGGYYGFVYVNVDGDKSLDVMIRPNVSP